ncbi:lipoprotein [[Acholeplasma] multilocale]|uniref:lipoprotein n=1 Tax=[Acholeplasma] multilocale TaxID=264638 RepID=UPI00047A0C59|nr:lipoprotein [[Acholeplasma] multilocale]
MRKLLVILGAVSLVATTGAAVVSCTQVEDTTKVILEIEQDVSKPEKAPFKAYQAMVDKFNAKLKSEGSEYSKMEVVVQSAPKGDIIKKITSGETLPNLYVTYPDNVTLYETQVGADKVIDMRAVINWDNEWIESLNTQKQVGSDSANNFSSNFQYENLKDFKNNFKVGNEATNNRSLEEILKYDLKKVGDEDAASQYANAEFPEYEKTQFFKPLTYSFLSEAMTTSGKMYGAPTGKSMNYGMLNKRLLAELVYRITDGEVDLTNETQFSNLAVDENWNPHETLKGYEDVVIKQSKSTVFGDPSKKFNDVKVPDFKNQEATVGQTENPTINIYAGQSIKELFKTWFAPKTDEDQYEKGVYNAKDIQNIVADADKILVLSTAFYELAKQTKVLDNEDNKGKMFSLSIDDTPGFIYGTDRNSTGIELEQNPQKKFFNWDGTDAYTLKINDKSGTTSVDSVAKFFNYMNQLVPLAGNENHNGGLLGGNPSGSIYGSNYFINGNMLVGMGSTAGASYSVTAKKIDENGNMVNNDTENKVYDNNALAVATPAFYRDSESETGEVVGQQRRQFGIQQGPGLSMFKATTEKQQDVAIRFANYFMEAKSLSDYSANSGYIPSNYYSYVDIEKEVLNAGEGKVITEHEVKEKLLYNIEHGEDHDESTNMYYENFGSASIDSKNNTVKTKISFDKYMHQIVDSIAISALATPNATIMNDELTTTEKEIATDTGLLYSQSPSPYGNGMRFFIFRDWVATFYGLSDFANADKMKDPEKELTLNNFWSKRFHNPKDGRILVMATNANSTSKVVYESSGYKEHSTIWGK